MLRSDKRTGLRCPHILKLGRTASILVDGARTFQDQEVQMATTKKVQLNAHVDITSRRRAKLCAVARGVSINQWVQEAIDDKAAAEGIGRLEESAEKLAEYVPGRVATLEQMLKMAAIVAEHDTDDGLDTRYVPAAEVSPKRKSRARKPARRSRASANQPAAGLPRAAAPRR